MRLRNIARNFFLCSALLLILASVFYLLFSPKTIYKSEKELTQINDYLYVESDVSDEEIETAQTLVGYLPPSLFQDFRNVNGRVIIVSDLKGDTVGRTEISRNDDITIYIKNEYSFDALLHEFGHVYLHNHPEAMNEEFKKLYETEAKSLVTAYYGDSPYYYEDENEYFAQAFQTVLCMRGYDTQEAAPDTFNYMIDIFQNLFNE